MKTPVLIVVTHLLGAGHLTRAAALARAFAERGHPTTLVSGGRPSKLVDPSGIDVVQLPPVHIVGTDFKTLLGDGGSPATESLLDARRELLLATLDRVRPGVVITELFPFGRRVLAREFLDLLEAARSMRPRPLIAASIRDILVAPTKPARIEETRERLERFYDLVLVHGDPALVPLDASWPVDDRIRPYLQATGYVDEGSPVTPAQDRRGIVVSGGSSAASLPLYSAAMKAARLLPDQPWRVLVGNGVAEETFQAFRDEAPAHVAVERARPDFRSLLAGAAVSVSQAGYNTVVDLLRTGPVPVLVPFEAGHETEQPLRAERLSRRGLALVIREAELTAEGLALAIHQALARKPRSAPAIDLDGAARSVALVADRVQAPAVLGHLDFSPLETAIRRASDAGVRLRFWWRDDDAVSDTAQLWRLLDLAATHRCPVALAVVPARLDASLTDALDTAPAEALVHGWAHRNHAPQGEKKAEFGAHRALTAMEMEVRKSLRQARSAIPSRIVPVFVPPWNRITPQLHRGLAQAGYRGLSTFNDRVAPEAAPGLIQVNTHLDPIEWRGTRSLADPARLIAAAAAAVERRIVDQENEPEPIGLLTHHLVQDEATWRFCEAFVERLLHCNMGFSPASELFLAKKPDRRSSMLR